MSVLIKGMEMPKDGVYWCEIGVAGDIATITIHGEERKSFPLIPIPEPHGRLGDLDALPWYLANTPVKYATYEDWEMLCDAITAAPTVIPASEEG